MAEDEKRVAIEKCGNCRFYFTQEYEEDDVEYERTYGLCTRYPPKRIDGSVSGFPMVEDECWCGEYKKNLPKVTIN